MPIEPRKHAIHEVILPMLTITLTGKWYMMMLATCKWYKEKLGETLESRRSLERLFQTMLPVFSKYKTFVSGETFIHAQTNGIYREIEAYKFIDVIIRKEDNEIRIAVVDTYKPVGSGDISYQRDTYDYYVTPIINGGRLIREKSSGVVISNSRSSTIYLSGFEELLGLFDSRYMREFDTEWYAPK